MKKQKIDVYFGKSKIHGNGLFAKKQFKKDEIIGKIDCKPTDKDGPHVLWMNELTEGYLVLNELKYINHSTKPNACYYDDFTVVALKTIKKNDEITHNYGYDTDEI
ncbi:MAG: SET domain-containing protein-lysine N-methyltransferase [Methylococcales bacterium]|jgi:uncharacterized protein|nr:SET domain-containing protein-lysine N-methyltransferase [Methylococcales bacterium]MBT7408874.1 SET domain-containing protein-lysine N-methyltransferase [Methylococcales bacterium]